GLDREPEGYHRRMAEPATPIDDEGTVEIDDAPGWRYLPFGGSDDEIEVTVVRDADGCQLRFTVPAVVQRGAELGRVARIVIAARAGRPGGGGRLHRGRRPAGPASPARSSVPGRRVPGAGGRGRVRVAPPRSSVVIEPLRSRHAADTPRS